MYKYKEDPNHIYLALLLFFNYYSLDKLDGILLQFMFCTLELITRLKDQQNTMISEELKLKETKIMYEFITTILF